MITGKCDAVPDEREQRIGAIEFEQHDGALAEMVRDIQGKLLGVELMIKLQKLNLQGVDFAQAKTLALAAAEAVRTKTLGYAQIVGQKG